MIPYSYDEVVDASQRLYQALAVAHLLDSRTKRRPWYRKEEYVYPRAAAAAAKIVRAE
jgi:hypothetical protein